MHAWLKKCSMKILEGKKTKTSCSIKEYTFSIWTSSQGDLKLNTTTTAGRAINLNAPRTTYLRMAKSLKVVLVCLIAFRSILASWLRLRTNDKPNQRFVYKPIKFLAVFTYDRSLRSENKLFLLYKHQWNTRKSLARKNHIFTRKNNVIFTCEDIDFKTFFWQVCPVSMLNGPE